MTEDETIIFDPLGELLKLVEELEQEKEEEPHELQSPGIVQA